jgi:hypothetical protein
MQRLQRRLELTHGPAGDLVDDQRIRLERFQGGDDRVRAQRDKLIGSQSQASRPVLAVRILSQRWEGKAIRTGRDREGGRLGRPCYQKDICHISDEGMRDQEVLARVAEPYGIV